jgi:hypothetical protein
MNKLTAAGTRGMLVTFRSRVFCLPVCIQKHKDWNIQSHNVACCFVSVWNLVSHVEGGILAEGVREQGAEGNIRLKRNKVKGKWRRLHNEGLHDLYCLPNVSVYRYSDVQSKSCWASVSSVKIQSATVVLYRLVLVKFGVVAVQFSEICAVKIPRHSKA